MEAWGTGQTGAGLASPPAQLSVCTFLVLGFLAWQGKSGIEPEGKEAQIRR